MTLESLAWGYGLIEGPRVDEKGRLFFSDVRRGGVYCREPDGRITTVVPKRRGVGGIALHADGGLVISGRDISHVREGQTRLLFGRDDVGGWNDIFTDALGRVFAGSLRSDPFGADAGHETGELWLVEKEGRGRPLYGGVRLSNGIGLSPDGRLLYHSDSRPREIVVHELSADGAAVGRRVLARTRGGAPDGLAVDEQGGVWVAVYGAGRVARYSEAGELSLEIEVPARAVTSLCFGGADLCDLYIVTADNTEHPECGGTIFRTRADVPGLPAPRARI